jgi:hypothetical protein
MVAQVERGEFEELLLSKAEVTGNLSMWTCTVCKADNKKEQDVSFVVLVCFFALFSLVLLLIPFTDLPVLHSLSEAR